MSSTLSAGLASEPENGTVRFVLDVNLPDDSDVRDELGRILRYWGGAMKELDDLEPGDKQDIYDSAYNRVGSWAVSTDAD
jgi:hypothetical protein